jgi:hypothetical protein
LNASAAGAVFRRVSWRKPSCAVIAYLQSQDLFKRPFSGAKIITVSLAREVDLGGLELFSQNVLAPNPVFKQEPARS